MWAGRSWPREKQKSVLAVWAPQSPCWEKVSPDGGPDGGAEPRGPGRGSGEQPLSTPGESMLHAGGREDSPSSCSRPGSQWVSQGWGVSFLQLPQQSPTEQGA